MAVDGKGNSDHLSGMFDQSQLRSFAVLARLRHFGRAAEQLCITQPALTRRIQLLEADIGVELFWRTGRGVELSAAGIAFLPEADGLLAQMEAARRVAQKAAGTLSGRVTIGFDGAASYTLIPRLIERTAAALPQLAIDFVEASSLDQMSDVHFHRLDIGFVRPLPHHLDLVTQNAFAEPLALAVPVGHRLAGRRRLTLGELEGEPFVAYSERGLYLRDLIGDVLRQAGVRPRVVQSMSRTHSILALVSTGLGIAIVPAGSAAAAFDNILFKRLPIEARAEWHAARHVRPTNDLVLPLCALLQDLDRQS
jgi:DNA-binding transcriptional LysR family regulator